MPSCRSCLETSTVLQDSRRAPATYSQPPLLHHCIEYLKLPTMTERIGITVRLNPDDHYRLRMLAAHSGRSIGGTARDIVLDYLDDVSPTTFPPTPVRSTESKSRRSANRSKNKKKKR